MGSKPDRLTVGDMFCGAGGFSEGFEQAGFDIRWGVDNWEPARTTFKNNHPEATVLAQDILSLDPKNLEPVDVLIGSPPCTHFSLANRGGNGNRKLGMRLVEKFLECVDVMSPKYWVMENVPSLLRELEKKLDGDKITIDRTELEVPGRLVLNAAEYGAPQARKRLFSGDFPLPHKTHGEDALPFRTLRSVLESLPDPIREPQSRKAQDPVYPGHFIAEKDLRDHFEDTRWRLTREELALAKEHKLRDRIYGEMSYPDDIDRPSRTITATRTHGSRMTIIVPRGEDSRSLRTLTTRECATIQGFPFSYQFWAESFGGKDVLVGNAVSPPAAFAIAQSIREAEGLERIEKPLIELPAELPPPTSVQRAQGPRRLPRRRFRFGVDIDWEKNHRLELENHFILPDPSTLAEGIETEWHPYLYLGYARKYRSYLIDLPIAFRLSRALVDGTFLGVSSKEIHSLASPILNRCLNGGFTDGTSLQRVWNGESKVGISPTSVLRWIEREVNQAFPKEVWKDKTIPRIASRDILDPALAAKGKGRERGQPLEISVRLAASSLALAIVCERLNHGPDKVENLRKKLSEWVED